MTVIAELPPELVLTFKGKIRLTRVFASLAGGDRQELDLSGHTGFENRISLPLVSLGVGEYLIEWRGLGEDGHAMRGDFSFTLK